MKKLNMFILTILLILLFIPALAMAQDVEPDVGMNVGQIIVYLTPFIVFGVGQLVKLVNDKIKGVWLLVLVGTSSGVLAWITTSAAGAETWLLQFAYGMLSVIFHQFYKQIKSGN